MARKYVIEVAIYNKNQQIKSNCNSVTFVNPVGSGVNFTVNDIPVIEGNELEISGLEGEEDTTLYIVNFGTTTGTCIVIKKVYQ